MISSLWLLHNVSVCGLVRIKCLRPFVKTEVDSSDAVSKCIACKIIWKFVTCKLEVDRTYVSQLISIRTSSMPMLTTCSLISLGGILQLWINLIQDRDDNGVTSRSSVTIYLVDTFIYLVETFKIHLSFNGFVNLNSRVPQSTEESIVRQ